jgi:hypothetical protein
MVASVESAWRYPNEQPSPMIKEMIFGDIAALGRGGHAPGDLRGAFIDAVEAMGQWTPGNPIPTVEVRDQLVSVTSLSDFSGTAAMCFRTCLSMM